MFRFSLRAKLTFISESVHVLWLFDAPPVTDARACSLHALLRSGFPPHWARARLDGCSARAQTSDSACGICDADLRLYGKRKISHRVEIKIWFDMFETLWMLYYFIHILMFTILIAANINYYCELNQNSLRLVLLNVIKVNITLQCFLQLILQKLCYYNILNWFNTVYVGLSNCYNVKKEPVIITWFNHLECLG